MKFSFPSKTFLLGEYVALEGGPALMLGHAPLFEFAFANSKEAQSFTFHQDSPAGAWADIHEEFFANTKIEYLDPHNGAGGFGASTAQFLAVYLYVLSRQNMLRGGGTDLSNLQKWAIVEDYRQLFEDEDVPPSGYDLMAQMQKGLTAVHGVQQKTEPVVWPFKDSDILVYKTASKVKTHEHLQDLEISELTLKELTSSVERCLSAIHKKDRADFMEGVKTFAATLQNAGLLAAETAALIQKWNDAEGVLASKGCGAMGADVFVVFVDATFKPPAELAKNLKLIWSTREPQS